MSSALCSTKAFCYIRNSLKVVTIDCGDTPGAGTGYSLTVIRLDNVKISARWSDTNSEAILQSTLNKTLVNLEPYK